MIGAQRHWQQKHQAAIRVMGLFPCGYQRAAWPVEVVPSNSEKWRPQPLNSQGPLPDWPLCSCGMKLNLDYLLEMLWEYLALTCIYTKKRGRELHCT